MMEYQPLFLTDDEDQAEAPIPPPPQFDMAIPRDRWYLVVGIVALGIAPVLMLILALLIK
jgi:hypothetical protein